MEVVKDFIIKIGLSGSWGTPKSPGNRSSFASLSEAVLFLKSGGTVKSLRDEHTVAYVLHKNKLLDYAIELKGSRNWAMEILVFVGPSGSGKSTTAKSEFPDAYNCPWPVGGRWWKPNYYGQETIILDEFVHQISLSVMLKLMDRHAWNGTEAKNRSFQFVSKRVVITTNLDPRDWYPKVKTSCPGKKALLRRIREFAKIYDFDGTCVYPDFHKDLRGAEFNWRQFNFSIFRSAGIGDQRSGNGYY